MKGDLILEDMIYEKMYNLRLSKKNCKKDWRLHLQ